MITWSDELATGIAVIDEDHKFLVSLINKFGQFSEDGSTRDQILVAVDALTEYAQNHFRREEVLMMVCTYGEREQHQREHHLFAEVVGAIRALYVLRAELVNVKEVVRFLSEWLKFHIMISDFGYVGKMKSNAVLIDSVAENLRDDVNFSFS